MRIRALKTYRCGEPPGGTTDPPKKIADLMVRLLWTKPAKYDGRRPSPRIIKGCEYPTFPVELGKALVADGSAEEIDRYGNVTRPAAKPKASRKENK